MSHTRTQPRRHSFEFFPPKTDKGREKLLQTIARLGNLQPEFVSVTFGAGGSTRDRSYETCTDILKATPLEVTPHLSCIGSSREDLDRMLSLYKTVGVKRIMALRGDAPEDAGDQGQQDFRYANELVEFIKNRFPDFQISVACYPEYHPESKGASDDLNNFVRKVKAGADEAISQYFFTNEAYYRFRDDVAKQGVHVPLVPGIMPIMDFGQIERFSKFCGADIPMWIRKRMSELGPEDQLELGIEIATRQSEDLIRNGAPALHFYTLNKAKATERIWDNLGLSGGASHAASSVSTSN